MSLLDKKRREIEKMNKELDAKKYNVDQALVRISQVESQRIVNLARLYDNMKPNEVARLFANLGDSVVLQILPRMKPGNASKILALMPPRRAAKISKQLVTVMEN